MTLAPCSGLTGEAPPTPYSSHPTEKNINLNLTLFTIKKLDQKSLHDHPAAEVDQCMRHFVQSYTMEDTPMSEANMRSGWQVRFSLRDKPGAFATLEDSFRLTACIAHSILKHLHREECLLNDTSSFQGRQKGNVSQIGCFWLPDAPQSEHAKIDLGRCYAYVDSRTLCLFLADYTPEQREKIRSVLSKLLPG